LPPDPQFRGGPVYNAAGEKLGKIEDVMLDKPTGRTRYAVLSFGGLLGIGDRHYPLPWEVLRYDTSMGGYVVNLDKRVLENAPSYLPDESVTWDDPEWSRRLYEHYGVTRDWNREV
jgi:hypothetical protein